MTPDTDDRPPKRSEVDALVERIDASIAAQSGRPARLWRFPFPVIALLEVRGAEAAPAIPALFRLGAFVRDLEHSSVDAQSDTLARVLRCAVSARADAETVITFALEALAMSDEHEKRLAPTVVKFVLASYGADEPRVVSTLDMLASGRAEGTRRLAREVQVSLRLVAPRLKPAPESPPSPTVLRANAAEATEELRVFVERLPTMKRTELLPYDAIKRLAETGTYARPAVPLLLTCLDACDRYGAPDYDGGNYRAMTPVILALGAIGGYPELVAPRLRAEREAARSAAGSGGPPTGAGSIDHLDRAADVRESISDLIAACDVASRTYDGWDGGA